MDPLKEGELELIIIWLEFYLIKKILSKCVLHIMFCTSQIPSLAFGRTSGRVLMSEYKCGICTNKQLSWEKEFTLMKKYLEHLCKV